MLKSAGGHKEKQLSVVIATLGGPSLQKTIERLNEGSIVPDEILICIPSLEAERVKNIGFQNVKIVVTECRGQVAQRAIGFQKASHPMVMQLDDDLLVDHHCIQHLLTSMNTYGPKVAVAPCLMDISTGESIYKNARTNVLWDKLYYWFINGAKGYQPGGIACSGSVIGVDPACHIQEKLVEVEWVPGGCVLHDKENLILNDYYPFKGKAYFEDVMHSYYLKQAGIKLMVNVEALCWLEPIISCNFTMDELFKQFRARKYTMQLFPSASFIRIYMVHFARCIIYKVRNLSK
jgi:glycosyltransferase involved in cell wall biosynthesis